MTWNGLWKVAIAGLVIAGIPAIAFHPLHDLLLRMDGHVVFVDRPIRTVSARPGEKVVTTFAVRNVARGPIKILGAETHCGCATVTNLPLEIPPGEWRDVNFRVATGPEDAGKQVSRDARLFIDRASPAVVLLMRVQVADKRATSQPEVKPTP